VTLPTILKSNWSALGKTLTINSRWSTRTDDQTHLLIEQHGHSPQGIVVATSEILAALDAVPRPELDRAENDADKYKNALELVVKALGPQIYKCDREDGCGLQEEAGTALQAAKEALA
jgi:hypothetical protein